MKLKELFLIVRKESVAEDEKERTRKNKEKKKKKKRENK